MIITTPPTETAEGHVAEMYDDDLRVDGIVFSHTRAMVLSPEAHEAFVRLIAAVVPSIGIRVYEAATLGAARAIGSSHCLLALAVPLDDVPGLDAAVAGALRRATDTALSEPPADR